MAHRSWKQVAALLIVGLSSPCLAQTRSQVTGSDLDRQTMTAYFQADVGMTTYESETVNSKETSQNSTWTFGTFAGESRKLGITLHSSEAEVPFTLNESQMRTSFKDLRLHSRLGWFTASIAAALNEISIFNTEADIVDLYGSSVGAGLAFNIPLWDRAVVSFDHVFFNKAKIFERNGRNIALGQRQNSEISASFDVTSRVLDFLVGYRHRSYELAVDQTKNKEVQMGAFVGFRLGVYF